MRTCVLTILALVCTCFAAWAEPAWKATLTVGEEYNDNTGEERNGEEDFITYFRPSLSYNHDSSRLQFRSAYSGDYRFYARETEDEEFNHNLNARALFEAYEDLFFIDASDTYRLVNEDRTRGDIREEDSTSELVQQNVFTMSPYFTPRFGARTSAKVGYAYSNIWYDDPDKDSKNIHRGFLDGDYELSPRTSVLSGYSYTMELSDEDTLDRHIVYLGGRHAYSDAGSVHLKIGPKYSRYRDRGTSSTNLFWDAGLNHDFGYVQLNLATGISFEDDPDTGETYERKFATLTLSKAWERTKASVFSSFEDYEDSVEEGDYSKGTESVQRTAFGLNISRELTSRLTGTLGLVHDFEDGSDGDKRWYANLGLTYALTENMNLGAWYRFKDVSSDDEEEDYSVNRIGLQLSMVF